MTCECTTRSKLRRSQGRKPMLPSNGQCVCDCRLLEQLLAHEVVLSPLHSEDAQRHALVESANINQ